MAIKMNYFDEKTGCLFTDAYLRLTFISNNKCLLEVFGNEQIRGLGRTAITTQILAVPDTVGSTEECYFYFKNVYASQIMEDC